MKLPTKFAVVGQSDQSDPLPEGAMGSDATTVLRWRRDLTSTTRPRVGLSPRRVRP